MFKIKILKYLKKFTWKIPVKSVRDVENIIFASSISIDKYLLVDVRFESVSLAVKANDG